MSYSTAISRSTPRRGLAVLAPAILFFALSLMHSPGAIAAPGADGVQGLIQQARALHLAKDPYWLALLEYPGSKAPGSGEFRSEVISPDFFLSHKGNTDPAAELTATLKAFFRPPGADPNKDAQCRFIARYRWLRQKLDWTGTAPPSVTCSKYLQWTKHNRVRSLSLVFATGYLGNPASYYGHILLKFNFDRRIVFNNLLDQSVSFGAVVPPHQNPLVYVIKGLFGGYKASFSHIRFYRQNQIYVDNQFRDLWEYHLALTPEEVRRIVDHSWELLGVHFRYYFLKQNCAYAMASLLEPVVHKPLLPHRLPWSMPVTVFERLAHTQHNGKPLVSSIRRIPSRISRFRRRYAGLDKSERKMVKRFVRGSGLLQTPAYVNLPGPAREAVIDTLLQYYMYRIVKKPDDLTLKHKKQQLLVARIALPAEAPSPARDPTLPPSQGVLPNMFRIGVVHNDVLGSGVAFSAHPAYYDLLNTDVGRLPYSALSMLDLKVVDLGGQVQLRRLDLVKVETLNLSLSGLPGDGGLAWKLRFGFRSHDLACTRCTVFRVTGGFGKATALGPHTAAYAMAQLYAQSAYANEGPFGGGLYLGAITTPIPQWRSSLRIGYRASFQGGASPVPVIQWQNRFGNNRHHDLRFSIERDVATEATLSYSLYL